MLGRRVWDCASGVDIWSVPGVGILMQHLSGESVNDDRIVHAVDRAAHEIVEMRLGAWPLSVLSVSGWLAVL